MSGVGLVAVGALKGSPGVTTAALALAAVWPAGAADAGPLLVEADPSGGDVAGWYGLLGYPGLLAWAAAARGGAAAVDAHVWALAGGVGLVAAPVEAGSARGAVAVLAQTGSVPWAASGRLVVADCGRLDPGSVALPIAGAAGVLVVLARPVPAELARVAGRVEELTGAGRRDCVLVLAGEPEWSAGRVEEAVGLPVVGVIPHHPRAAAGVAGGRFGRGARRSQLLRAAADIAADLDRRLAGRRGGSSRALAALPSAAPLPAVPPGSLPRAGGRLPVVPGATFTISRPGGQAAASGWVPTTPDREGWQ
ncbi:hypothetical protein Ga0074812_15031 [Parafrankia irregularis]|uniref:MinD-like ATPase involved in chromosome partitioning or flagellar assembly n=1 Tax=Parafrankia irregularis TaxID=795642 RepID=A0A0S4QZP4_9ACTN|nr:MULTISPECIES: hypothetical protein [Frankiaceae]MBE3204743.1 hypothetical protein [Parafrankia sp. CH37]CUU60931.1 hypothetical protein Ga0074812_15031 [Parafrankia irregularis]